MATAAALKAQFDMHSRLFRNVLDGITDADASSITNEHINHMKWIAGHLLNTRATSFSRLAGLQPDDSYAAQFARGVSLDLNATYPPIGAITEKWQAISPAISAGLATIPEEVLASPSPGQVPIADTTIRGLLAFLVSHEAYHIGQLSLLRKMVGKPAMSYN